MCMHMTCSPLLLTSKGRASGPALWTAPQEALLCCCSTSCSRSPPASQPITTWYDCRPSRSPASCKTVRLSPSWSRNQRQAWWAGCSASETRRAGGSSSPCELWTDQDSCASRCRPPPSRCRAASPTRASSSSTSPSPRTRTEPLCCSTDDSVASGCQLPTRQFHKTLCLGHDYIQDQVDTVSKWI